ncbi:DHA2 family multidrug resistance protein-like MFS transporter [Erwinia toletana]|uniref:DHA2 family multidrug resistance protein-like MFS transporter n=1 Tax=Winslowiella toletana TaxID=92490 RepID=A0ABS4PAB9_9GAMM|nr:MFS transporter [Winslowiella toletana]MBP2169596.1 DHA2 family multidrug resistance protein-like MFS transporter [Winslowiella toletana]
MMQKTELFSDQPGDEGLPGRERGLAMAAVMTTTTMAVFDGSMVNIALPQIARSLEVSAASAVWVANGYLLSAAMTLAIFAALAARIGFRTLFTTGLLLFTLASLGCALSSSLDMLVVMRLLQGIGGAATLSIAPAILRSIFPNRLLGRILGLNALLIAASTAIAPVLGGTLLSTTGWQWLFAINIPLGLIAMILSLRVIPGKQTSTREPFDIAGAILSAVMLGALIMAANSFSRPGEGALAPETLNTAITYGLTAIIAGLAFIWRQRRAAKPLLPLDMFASARFSLAALTSLASFISQGITFVALPFLFQSVYGYSAFVSALLFIPWPLGIVLAAPHAGRLADRYPAAIISTVGLCVFAAGLVLLAQLPEHAQAWDIGARSLLCGIGFGCFQSPNNREILSNASRVNSGYASGVLAIMRTFGQCLGAALVGVILSLYVLPLNNPLQEALAVRLSLWVAVAATVLAMVMSFSRVWRGRG